ncbi:hypothetical protein [Nostoc sp.]|uniref:hypothetical protein n=1 Tax=Nostoc sp. TaxID=1180 RepID=UPI002FFC00DD
MFLAIFKKVKDFFIRIVKDETFHSQLLSKKVEDLKKAVENGSMQIADLPYLQNVSKDELILGSAGVNVISGAFAFGSDSYPFASANSSSKAWSTDDYTSNGTGLSEAWGDNATANLATAGNGNIVIGNTKFKSYQNTASASGSVISIDSTSVLSFSDLLGSFF